MTIVRFTVPSEPANEARRMEIVRAYGLDRPSLPPDEVLDDLVADTAARFNAPITLISIVGRNQQCFRSCVGLGVNSTPRSISFCGHAILQPEPLVVADARLDPRFAGNPLVQGPPHIRSYFGAPLISPEGPAIGTLCVIDTIPRTLDAEELSDLVARAGRVMARLVLSRPR
jgi:GAF domain-containing protein